MEYRFELDTLKKVMNAKSYDEALKSVSKEQLLELAQRFCRVTVKKLEMQREMRQMYASVKK